MSLSLASSALLLFVVRAVNPQQCPNSAEREGAAIELGQPYKLPAFWEESVLLSQASLLGTSV